MKMRSLVNTLQLTSQRESRTKEKEWIKYILKNILNLTKIPKIDLKSGGELISFGRNNKFINNKIIAIITWFMASTPPDSSVLPLEE